MLVEADAAESFISWFLVPVWSSKKDQISHDATQGIAFVKIICLVNVFISQTPKLKSAAEAF